MNINQLSVTNSKSRRRLTLAALVSLLILLLVQSVIAAPSLVIVESTGTVGSHISMVLDASGFPTIAYNNGTNLRIAKCNDATCTAPLPTYSNPTTASTNGAYNSIALTSGGIPYVAHQQTASLDAVVTQCSNASCTTGTLRDIENFGQSGYFTSLAMTTADRPVIAYSDFLDSAFLRLATCANTTCNGGTTYQTVDNTVVVSDISLILNTSNFPRIAYYAGGAANDLRLAICTTTNCSAGNTFVNVDTTGNVGNYPSLALNSSGNAVISYYDATNGDLKLAVCNNATCSAPTLTTVDSTGNVGQFTSLKLGSGDLPRISYVDVTNGDLKVAVCTDTTCTSKVITTLDTASNVTSDTSLQLNSSGLPVIAYYDATAQDAKLAICDVTCMTAAQVQFNPTTVNASAESAGTVNLPVELVVTSGTVTSPLTLNVTYSGTATSSTDYNAPSTLTFTNAGGFTPGTYTQNIQVVISEDTLVEGNQTVIATISTSAVTVNSSASSRTINITDNDTATVAFSSSTSSVAEETTPHNVGATLTITSIPAGGGSLESAINVAVSAANVTATTPADYTLVGGTVFTFAGGSVNNATSNVNATIANDTTAENDETFTLTLGAVTGAATTTSPTTHTVTITDTDPIVVTNTNDTGVGSLSQAITDANNFTGADTINFNISGAGPHTIQLVSTLPDITGQVTIDGTTQPGSTCDVNARVLNIVVSGTAIAQLTLDTGSDNSIIRGLVLQNFNRAVDLYSDNNRVECNYIGLDQTGSTTGSAYDNSVGVFINTGSESNIIGTNSDSSGDLNERNVISGNSSYGILVNGNNNTIRGNYIGTDKAGMLDRGNSNHGIYISATNTTIGGTQNAQRNVISGNGTTGSGAGIRIENGSTATLYNNYVGVGSDGITAIGNEGNGFLAFNATAAATNHIVGGTGAGQGNIFANNGGRGIDITDIRGNSVRGNSIYNNGNIGLDLGSNGVTLNDNLDGDSGSNDLQNFPVITGASEGGTTVSGTLNSTANSTFTVDVYTNDVCDSSGYGEGLTWIGTTNVTTNGSGDASFNATVSTLGTGKFITATATNATGSTSEFSACFAPLSSTLVVTNTNESGAGSLHQAITDANAFPGANVINFNIPGTGPHTINLTSALPNITGTVTIDGSTQPGSSCTFGSRVMNIVLNGATSFSGITLATGSTGSIIRGLVIQDFANGISITDSSNSRIECNYIGTNANGTASGTGFSNNTGILGGSNVIIGTNGDGVNDANEGNLLSGNNYGIYVEGQTGATVSGNYVGTNAAGTAAIPNNIRGISYGVNSFNITIGTDGDGVSDDLEGNLVSGNNGQYGIFTGFGTGYVVAGNRVGTTANGMGTIPNVTGIFANQSGVRIGTDNNDPAERNIVAGNGHGIYVSASAAATIMGNYIGVGVDGTTSLGNTGVGILLVGDNDNGIIQNNIIANNSQQGVQIATAAATSNNIRFNSIYNNGALGIDLDAGGVTPNDVGDGDTGTNNLQNFPVITGALAGGTHIRGTLNSTPSTTFALDFYSNAACDASGNGEGQTFIITTNIITNSSGNATFDVTVPALTAGTFITATATDPAGNSSEFSACKAVNQPQVVYSHTGSDTTVTEAGTTDTYTVVLSEAPGADLIVTLTFDQTELTVNGQTDGDATLTFTPSNWNVAQSVTVVAVNDDKVEGVQTSNITHSASTTDTEYTPISYSPSNTVTVNITDNDTATLAFSSGSGSGTEGTTYTASVALTVNSNPAGGTIENGVSVLIGHVAGSATAVSDYTLSGFNVTFAAGSASGTQGFNVNLIEDSLVEGNEQFSLAFGTITGGNGVVASTSPNSQTVTITDNDTATVAFSSGTGSGAEGTTYTGTVTLTINSTPAGATLANAVTVAFSSATGSAIAADYSVTTASPLTFNSGSGSTTQNISVILTEDSLVEVNQQFTLNLGTITGQATAGATTAQTVTITDNDTATVAFASGSGSIAEETTPYTVNAVLTINSNPAGGSLENNAIIVVLGVDGTATNGTDYNFTFTGASFAAGAVNGAISPVNVPIIDDSVGEADETFVLVFGTPTGAFSASGITTHTVTITDTDPFVVTNTNDSGAGSLRQAITGANTRSGADSVIFAISGAGPHTINLTTALPSITGSVTIDGSTQPGSSCTFGSRVLNVVVNGPSAGNGFNLGAGSGGSIIRGLVIQDFTNGINLVSNANRVECNYIGTNASGTASGTGIRNTIGVLDGGNANYIGTNGDGTNDANEGNVISGNTSHGVETTTGTGHVIAGNYIGTTADGLNALGNGGTGVYTSVGNMRVGTNGDGTSDTEERNVISGNNSSSNAGGVWMNAADNNIVAGNYIGLNATGTAIIANSGFAAVTADSGADNNYIGTNGDGVGDTAERNVISGSTNRGIYLGFGAGNVVAGNYIGTDATGTVDLGNGTAGIWVVFTTSPRIGTNNNDPMERNIISGNNTYGIYGYAVDGMTVAGNYIGVMADGVTALGNTDAGIYLFDDADNNVIQSNVIANNGQQGVNIVAATAVGNRIRTNLIYNNSALGIDLGANGVTPNDIGDGDTGTNNLQNFPVITWASEGSLVIRGTLNSIANTTFDIDIYSNAACDTSGYGEGQTLLGSTTTTTDPSGNGTFLLSVAALPANPLITATATSATNGTSEFSTCPSTNVPPSVVFTETSGSTTVSESGTTDTYNVVLDTPPGADVVVNITFDQTELVVGGQTDGTHSLTFTPANWNVSQPVSVAAVNDNKVEGAQTSAVVHVATTTDTNYAPIAYSPSATVTVNITDNDTATVAFATGSGNIAEESTPYSVNAVLTITSSPAGGSLESGASIVITATNGTATAADYSLTTTSVNFAANAVNGATAAVNAAIVNDTHAEPNETFVLGFGAPTGAIAASGTITHTVTILDTDPLVVTNTNDSGDGSLRQVVNVANSRTGADTVTFNIPGTGPHVINVQGNTGFDIALTTPITLDGTTQPGTVCPSTPMVEIRGPGADGNQNNGLGVSSNGSVIRGLAITNFQRDGIEIRGDNNIVECTLVGLQADGVTTRTNMRVGISLTSGATNNRVGVESDAAADATDRNTIYHNAGPSAFYLDGTGAPVGDSTSGNIIAGNYIGTDVNGNALTNNVRAIWLTGGAHTNRIGSNINGNNDVLEGNLITGFTGNGVTPTGATTINNSIRGNSIYGITGRGIDLESNGVTANDTGDADTGGNDLQNFPVLPGAFADTTTVAGTLNSTASSTFHIDVYSNDVCDTEGRTWIGSSTVTTDASGNISFNVPVTTLVNGKFLTATATNATGSTSEFSACRQVTPLSVVITESSGTAVTEGGTTDSYTVVLSSNPGMDITVDLTFDQTELVVGGQTDGTYSLTFTSANWNTPQPVSVAAAEDSLVEGTQTSAVMHVGAGAFASLSVTPSNTVTVTITDNDSATVAFSSGTGSAAEGTSPYTTTVALTINSTPANGTLESGITVNIGQTAGTATTPADYTLTSGSVSIAFVAGATSGTQNVNVTIADDALNEGSEQFTLTLDSITGGNGAVTTTAPASQVVTIIDNDDATVALSGTATVSEAVGTHDLTVTLTTGGGTLPSDVTVQINLVNNTAVYNGSTGDMYFTGPANSTTVTFPAGSANGATRTAAVTINNDAVVENNVTDEIFTASIGTVTGPAAVSGGAATVTIDENDFAYLTINQGTVNASETNGTHTGQILIRMVTNPSTGGTLQDGVTVPMEDRGGSGTPPQATPGDDYSVNASTVVNIPAGAAANSTHSFTPAVTIVNDNLVEGSEAFDIGFNHTAYSGVPILAAPTDNNNCAYLSPNPTSPCRDRQTVIITDNDSATVAFSNNTGTVSEATTPYTTDVTVTVNSNPSGGSIARSFTVAINSADGTATNPADYGTPTTPLTFAAGATTGTTQSVTTSIVDDSLIEGNETFTLSIGTITPTGNTTSITASGATLQTVTITDNESATVAFANGTGTVAENASPYSTNLVLTTNPAAATLANPLTVAISDIPGTATTPADYGTPTTATFSAGAGNNATAATTTTIADDSLVEGNENFVLTIGSISNSAVTAAGTVAQTVTITDNDSATVALSGGATVSEADGTHDLTVTLSTGGATLASPVTVAVNLNNNTAVYTGIAATSDMYFTGPSNTATVTFPAGAGDGATQTAAVTINNDALVENNMTDESFTASLGTVTGTATTTGGPVTVTIDENDFASLTYSPDVGIPSLDENIGTYTHYLKLTLTTNPATGGSLQDAANVPLEDRTGAPGPFTATGGGVDYTLNTTVVNIPAGATHNTDHGFDIAINDDSLDEEDEYFNIGIKRADYTGVPAIPGSTSDDVVFVIVDNDNAGVTITENDGGTAVSEDGATNDNYSVVLNSQPTSDVTVTLTFNNDLTVESQNDGEVTLTFNSGNWNQAQTVDVAAFNDALVEGTHTSTISHAVTSADGRYNNITPTPNGNVVVTITDNDTATVAFTSGTGTVSEAAGPYSNTLTLTIVSNPAGGTLESAVTVPINNTPGTATTPADYGSPVSDVVFGAGSAAGTQTLSVSIVNDTLVEGDENFVLSLGTITGAATASGTITQTVTITDNDTATIVFVDPSSTVAETTSSHDVTARLDIVSNGSSGGTLAGDLVANVNVTLGSAESTDFIQNTAQVTFAGGSADGATRQINFTIGNDRLLEGSETFSLGYTLASGTGSVSAGTHTVTITDDETGTITFNETESNTGEAAGTHNVALSLTIGGTGSGNAQLESGASVVVTNTPATATAADYSVASPVNFAAGVNSPVPANIVATIVNDALVEGNETFALGLDAVTSAGAVSATGTHTVTITDNDLAVVAFAAPTGNAPEQTTPYSVNAVLTLTTDGTGTPVIEDQISVVINAANGTAGASDYDATTTTSVTFPANAGNSATQPVNIGITNDQLVEGAEDFTLSFGNVTGMATADAGTHVVTIIDNDSAVVAFAAPTGNAPEATTPYSVNAVLTLTTDGTGTAAIEDEVTVDINQSAGTATLTDDYSLSTTLVTFDANTTSGAVQPVNVAIVDDNLDEADEDFTLSFGTVTGTATANGTHVVTIIDDDEAGIVITQSGTTDVTEGGAEDSYEIVLTTQPTSTVTITLNFGNEVTVEGEATSIIDVTFDETNWNVPLVVNVVAVDDREVEGPHSITIGHTVASADNNYHNITPTPGAGVTVNIADNDLATITFATANGSAPEATTPYTVNALLGFNTLGSGSEALQTTVSAVINETAASAATPADYTLPPTTVTFTAADATPKTVSVTIENDQLVEGDETFSLGFGATTGPVTTSGTHVVTITDNDSAAITFAAPTGDAPEAVTPYSVNAVLTLTTDGTGTAAIEDEISVAISETAGTATLTDDYSLSTTLVTFDANASSGATQPVNVAIVNDDFDEADETFTLNFGAVTGAATASDTHLVTIIDNDVAGVIVTETDTMTTVSETTATTPDVYNVRLASMPTADVEIVVTFDAAQVSVNNETDGEVRFIIAPNLWNVDQPVSVTAVDDMIDETDPHTSLITHAAVSTDTNYGSAAVNSVTVNISDNDSAGVVITESGTTDLDEANMAVTDSYTVVLNSQPLSNVTVSIAFDAAQVSINGETDGMVDLVFDMGNWNSAQAVTVGVVDDLIDETTPHTTTLTHSASSTDSLYSPAPFTPVSVVTVNITDNDGAELVLSPTNLTITEGGATASYTAVLNSQPTSDVTVTLTFNSAEIQVNGLNSPVALTFNAGNWHMAQTLTVSAIDDFSVDASTETITHDVTSADLNYNALVDQVVTVNILDGITAVPAAFALLRPVDDIMIINPALLTVFHWEDTEATSPGITFDIKVDRIRPSAAAGVLTFTGLTRASDSDAVTCDGTICVLTIGAAEQALLTDGTYEWNVVAHNGIGSTNANAPFRFTINMTAELIVNGGFEIQGANKRDAEAWTEVSTNGAVSPNRNLKRTCRPAVVHSGDCAFRFKVDGVNTVSYFIKQKIKPMGYGLNGDVLHFSGWFKSKKLNRAARVRIFVMYPAESGIARQRMVVKIKRGTRDYTQVMKDLTLNGTPDRIKIKVMMGMSNSGKLWADDLSLIFDPNATPRSAMNGQGLMTLPSTPKN